MAARRTTGEGFAGGNAALAAAFTRLDRAGAGIRGLVALVFAAAFAACLAGGGFAWAASDVDGSGALAPSAARAGSASAVNTAGKTLSSGAYIIKLRSAPTVAFGVSGGSIKTGARVVAGKLRSSGGDCAQRFYLERGKDGRYAVFSVCSGLALTVTGSKVSQAGYTGGAGQRFSITAVGNGSYVLRSKSGKALSAGVSGSKVEAKRPQKGASSQQFDIVATDLVKPGVHSLRSASHVARVLGPKAASTKAGATVGLVKAKPGIGKVAIARSGAAYTMRVVGSGAYVAPSGARVKQLAKAARWKVAFAKSGKRRGVVFTAANGKSMAAAGKAAALRMARGSGARQAFLSCEAQVVDAGTYVFAAASGKVLDIDDGTYENGGNVQVWSRGDASAQIFTLKKKGGSWAIVSARTLKVLTEAGDTVVQKWYKGSKSQLWKAKLGKDGRIAFVNRASGRVLAAAGGGKRNGADVRAAKASRTVAGWALVPHAAYSLTGSAKLDRAVSKVLEEKTTLWDAFEYVALDYDYKGQNEIWSGDFLSKKTTAKYAWEMYKNKEGNCYRYAALFCVLARGLDYDARARVGYVYIPKSDRNQPHGWVEIPEDGEDFIYDTESPKDNAGSTESYYRITYDDNPLSNLYGSGYYRW